MSDSYFERQKHIKRFSIDIPDHLYRKLKIKSVEVDCTMRDYILAAILEKLESDKEEIKD